MRGQRQGDLLCLSHGCGTPTCVPITIGGEIAVTDSFTIEFVQDTAMTQPGAPSLTAPPPAIMPGGNDLPGIGTVAPSSGSWRVGDNLLLTMILVLLLPCCSSRRLPMRVNTHTILGPTVVTIT